MMNEMMKKALKYSMVSLEKDGSLFVNDFDGFDEDWSETLVEIPEELEEILDMLEDMGVRVCYGHEDI